jgi:hypothetical protein
VKKKQNKYEDEGVVQDSSHAYISSKSLRISIYAISANR